MMNNKILLDLSPKEIADVLSALQRLQSRKCLKDCYTKNPSIYPLSQKDNDDD